MPSLRKKTPPPVELEKPVVDKPGGKGRATPSRKEAEAARRGRPAARTSSDPKEAKRLAREDRRTKSQSYREAMLSGDISRLPPRERAPERVLAREYVDRRRNFGPIFLVLLLLNFASSVIPSTQIRIIFTYLLMFGLLVFVLDAVVLARGVTAAVRARHPDSRVAVKMYSIQRGLLPGRFRMPRPRGEVAGWLPASVRSLGRRG
ncbi:MAG TPA: DUF3043 domain-containing protein [Frankiaceae bacterium]|nr:DUF3043 domain-containing protein [Frankiaceae bacterium]